MKNRSQTDYEPMNNTDLYRRQLAKQYNGVRFDTSRLLIGIANVIADLAAFISPDRIAWIWGELDE